MSQRRVRKAPVVLTSNAARPHAAINKASGDPGPCAPATKPQQHKRSRNKIPKSIRYDLENALVGLCDVWFEEIKPHLVRNNIKLHVLGGEPGPASGDYRRLPPAAPAPAPAPAPACSHLHPGAALDRCLQEAASCAASCSTPPTASRARCRRPPARPTHSPPRLLLPTPLFQLSPLLAPQNQNKSDQNRQHHLRRKSRSPKSTSSPSTWRVPRICRTCVLSPPVSPVSPLAILRRIQNANESEPLHQDIQLNLKRTTMKNKSTQTDLTVSPTRSPTQQRCMFTSSFAHCPATTTFFPYKCEKNLNDVYNKAGLRSVTPNKPILSKEFDNIVGDKQDKTLKILYRSPIREQCSSVLNVIQSSKERLTREGGNRKKEPWR